MRWLVTMVYRRRVLPRALQPLVLGVSATALATMALHEHVWAHGGEFGAQLLPREADLEDEPAFAAVPHAVWRIPEALAPVANPALRAATPDATAPPTADANQVEVPELEGLGLRDAVRELKAVGLRVSVRDEYRDRVAVADWGNYEVAAQKIPFGTLVDRGTWVRMKVIPTERFAEGY